MRSIFFGSPDFVVPALNKLIESDLVSIEGVVTTPDSPIANRANQLKIPTFSLKDFEKQTLADENIADIYLVAAYGKFLSEELIEKPKYKTLNIHPSLLPQLRGTSPIKSVILNGAKETGVTVIQMDEKMDHGPILAQAEFPLTGKETFTELAPKLFTIGAELLVEALPHWQDYCDESPTKSNLSSSLPSLPSSLSQIHIPPQPQDHTQTTYTKKLTREDGKIDWYKTDEEINRMVRALNPWPGAWTTLASLRSAKVVKSENLKVKSQKANKVKILQTHLKHREKLIIDQLQVEGKNPISWKEFKAGYLKKA